MDLNKVLEDLTLGIKDLLKMGGKSVVGVDIGLSAVKVAEVQKIGDKKYKLLKFAAIDLPEGALIEDEIQKDTEIIEAITQALEIAGITTQNVCFGVSGPNTIARKLQLAGGSLEEIEDQVNWEAEQYIPFGVDESNISFHVFGENEGGGVDVLITAAKSDLIYSFKDLFERAKLRVRIVDMDLVAYTNVFEFVMRGQLEPNSSYLLIDFGAQKTELIIYKNNSIAFHKEMNIGGVMITEEIQRQMGVNYNEAEDLKTNGDDHGNLPEEILEIIDEVIEAFFSEIKKTLDFYVTSSSDESIVGAYVTGGGVLIPGITEGLEALLGVEVYLFNLFDKFEFDKKSIHQDDLGYIANRGVVSVGLAMRELK